VIDTSKDRLSEHMFRVHGVEYTGQSKAKLSLEHGLSGCAWRVGAGVHYARSNRGRGRQVQMGRAWSRWLEGKAALRKKRDR